MPSDRPWSDADRELVARTWYEAETPDHRLPAAWTDTGRHYRERADAVLDALTAAGWRDLSRASGYLIHGKLYDPRDVQIMTVTEGDDAR